MAITWDEKYSIGIEAVDNQHKKFIVILSSLSDALSEAKEKDLIADILRELQEYAEMHLAFEEKFFDKFHYENEEEHNKEHRYYRWKIQEFIDRHKVGDQLLPIEMLHFLEDWLEEHIMKSDKKYVECFRKNGIK